MKALSRKQPHASSGQLLLPVDDCQTKCSKRILLHQLGKMKLDYDGLEQGVLILLTHGQDAIEKEVVDCFAVEVEEGGRLGVDEVL